MWALTKVCIRGTPTSWTSWHSRISPSPHPRIDNATTPWTLAAASTSRTSPTLACLKVNHLSWSHPDVSRLLERKSHRWSKWLHRLHLRFIIVCASWLKNVCLTIATASCHLYPAPQNAVRTALPSNLVSRCELLTAAPAKRHVAWNYIANVLPKGFIAQLCVAVSYAKTTSIVRFEKKLRWCLRKIRPRDAVAVRQIVRKSIVSVTREVASVPRTANVPIATIILKCKRSSRHLRSNQIRCSLKWMSRTCNLKNPTSRFNPRKRNVDCQV